NDVFDACPHRVTGKALGVGDHDAIRVVSKDATKRVNLGGGAAAACRGVGFMGNENCLWRDLVTRNAAARFGLGDQSFHHLADVLDIETSTVERAVVCRGAQHFTDGLYSTITGGFGALHHQSCGAHADNHTVPPAVKGNGSICHQIVGGCRSTSQEASAHPTDQMVGGYVVCSDDNHPAA